MGESRMKYHTFRTDIDFLDLEWSVKVTFDILNMEVLDWNVTLEDHDANLLIDALDVDALNDWYVLLDEAAAAHIGAEPDWRAE